MPLTETKRCTQTQNGKVSDFIPHEKRILSRPRVGLRNLLLLVLQ